MPNSMDDDLELWKTSIPTSPAKSPALPWLFIVPTTMLFILQSPEPIKIQLTKRTFLDCALLSLHDSYWNNNSRDFQSIKLAPKLQTYHSRLRSLAEKDLLCQYYKNPLDIQTPAVMGPWIQRTLCLYGHDKLGRISYAKASLSDFSGSAGENSI
jgi:hypothetical protein